MKKEYFKPAMQVVELRHQHIICTSPVQGVRRVNNSEELKWKDGGFDVGDEDY